MTDEPYQSQYRTMVIRLRAGLTDESDCLYFVHTPVGRINVETWNYAIPGFVAITGEDEEKKARFIVFSEEEICSFPLEVKRKKVEASKETVGFKPTPQGDGEDRV